MQIRRISRSSRMLKALVTVLCIWSVMATIAVAASMELTGTAIVSSPGSSARGLYLTTDGNTLYIAGTQDRSVVKLDVASKGITARADLAQVDGGAYGKAVWVDSLGDVWAPLTVPIVAVYSSNLELKASYDLASFGVVDPEGILVSSSGDLYVTDRKGKSGIYKFRLENNKLILVQNWGVNGNVNVGKDLRQPCFTPSGDLLVGSFGGSEIYLVQATDGKVSVLTKDIKAPYHLASDATGHIYVAHYDRADVALSILNSDGTIAKTFTAAELGIQTETSGIAVSKDGTQIYILDQRTGEGGVVRMFRQ